jgi:hypothetical protein
VDAFQRRLLSDAAERVSSVEAAPSSSAVAAAAFEVAAVDGFSPYQLPMHAFIAWRQDECAIGNVCRALPSKAALRLLRYLFRWIRVLLADDSLLPCWQTHWCGVVVG